MLLVGLLIGSLFYYHNLISIECFKFIQLIIMIFCLLFNGCLLTKQSSNKKSIIIYNTLVISIFVGFTFLFSKFQPKLIIYYLVILSSSLSGSFFGKLKKQ